MMSFYNNILILLALGASTNSQSGVYFVDPYIQNVVWEGWGTSLAWFGDLLGGMDQDVIDEITSSLFSPTGLNFNIARYTIGGTTVGNYTCGDYRPGGATESYKDGLNEPFDWSKDPRQRKVLLGAKELGVDTFEAFSNTPPQWMTITGCSKGNSGGGLAHVNFSPESSGLFADYVSEVIEHFHNFWNITFSTYAPFNEPSTGGWFGEAQSQEGCCFDRPGLLAVVESMNQKFNEKGMDYVSISAFDETMVNVELTSQNWLNSLNKSHLVSKVNVHGYWNLGISQRDRLHHASVKNGHRLWMDEMGWAESIGSDMTQALTLSKRIVEDLRQMLPSAWLYWQAMEDYGGWGLVAIPYNNATAQNIFYNTGYFGMKQFSHHIKKNYNLVQSSYENSIAAYDENTKNLVIVSVNNEESSRNGTFDLSLFDTVGKLLITRTSSTEEHALIGEFIVIDKEFNFDLLPESITTFSFQNTILYSQPPQNLIQNGDFESEEEAHWYSNSNGSDIVTSAYVRSGELSGFIHPGDEEGHDWLKYSTVLNETRNYYLTAWCASGVSTTTRLLVEINGEIGEREILVNLGPGYHVYGIPFYGNEGDFMSIVFIGETNGIYSYIDDVILH